VIVIDASAVVEALVGRRPSVEIRDVLLGNDVAAPHLLDVEVVSALRGLDLAGKLSRPEADRALAEYRELAIDRFGFAAVAERVWELRHGFTSYDANYLALAEAFEAELITCDSKLSAPGHSARVRVIPRSG
jgi:predicted nucleic acid-binding protein